MECIDSTFAFSMAWSAVLIFIIAKVRSDNHVKSLLMELASPPILMALLLALIVTYFFYEPLPSPERKTLSTFILRPVHLLQSLACNFQTTFNILSALLPFVALCSYINKHNPEVIQSLKYKIRDFSN